MPQPNCRIVSLQQLRKPECTLCGLHASTTNVCVMGRGNEKAKIVLIGEAPGEAEAKTGKPFMGRSGQQLQRMIDELGLTNDVYITNVCKCRPPDNRTPVSDEIRTCGRTYLEIELLCIKPKIVVLLGHTASDYFLPINFTRGSVYRSERWPFALMPTWHPAYGLRAGPRIMGQIQQHLAAAQMYVQAKEKQCESTRT